MGVTPCKPDAPGAGQAPDTRECVRGFLVCASRFPRGGCASRRARTVLRRERRPLKAGQAFREENSPLVERPHPSLEDRSLPRSRLPWPRVLESPGSRSIPTGSGRFARSEQLRRAVVPGNSPILRPGSGHTVRAEKPRGTSGASDPAFPLCGARPARSIRQPRRATAPSDPADPSAGSNRTTRNETSRRTTLLERFGLPLHGPDHRRQQPPVKAAATAKRPSRPGPDDPTANDLPEGMPPTAKPSDPARRSDRPAGIQSPEGTRLPTGQPSRQRENQPSAPG